MNAKKFLLGAACALGLCLSSTAQTNPVYSVNAVGYVKLNLPAGFSMICSPLSVTTNGTTNVMISAILPTVPDGSLVYTFSGGGFDPVNAEYVEGVGWFNDKPLPPGKGAFIYVPTSTNVVFSGEVLQGSLTTSLPVGYSLVASQVPQSATLTALGFPAADGDFVFVFNSSTQTYDNAYEFVAGLGWFQNGAPKDPVIPAGTSFFAFKNGSAQWNRVFSVNP